MKRSAPSDHDKFNGEMLTIYHPNSHWLRGKKLHAMCLKPYYGHFEVLGVYNCYICFYRTAKYWAVAIDDIHKPRQSAESRQALLLSDAAFTEHFILIDNLPCDSESKSSSPSSAPTPSSSAS